MRCIGYGTKHAFDEGWLLFNVRVGCVGRKQRHNSEEEQRITAKKQRGLRGRNRGFLRKRRWRRLIIPWKNSENSKGAGCFEPLTYHTEGDRGGAAVCGSTVDYNGKFGPSLIDLVSMV
jgi:hypothetical protein